MIKVTKINKQGNRIQSYTCTDGKQTLDLTKEQLISYIDKKMVSNAKKQTYQGKTIIRINDKEISYIEVPKQSNIKTADNLNQCKYTQNDKVQTVDKLSNTQLIKFIEEAKKRGIKELSLEQIVVDTSTLNIRKVPKIDIDKLIKAEVEKALFNRYVAIYGDHKEALENLNRDAFNEEYSKDKPDLNELIRIAGGAGLQLKIFETYGNHKVYLVYDEEDLQYTLIIPDDVEDIVPGVLTDDIINYPDNKKEYSDICECADDYTYEEMVGAKLNRYLRQNMTKSDSLRLIGGKNLDNLTSMFTEIECDELDLTKLAHISRAYNFTFEGAYINRLLMQGECIDSCCYNTFMSDNIRYIDLRNSFISGEGASTFSCDRATIDLRGAELDDVSRGHRDECKAFYDFNGKIFIDSKQTLESYKNLGGKVNLVVYKEAEN